MALQVDGSDAGRALAFLAALLKSPLPVTVSVVDGVRDMHTLDVPRLAVFGVNRVGLLAARVH